MSTTRAQPVYKMCLDCIYSDLSRSERVSFRLTGKKFVFECLHERNYIAFSPDIYKNVSQDKHECDKYKPCPESLV